MTRNKSFDCIEMKRRGALKVHERLASMSIEEQVAYWRRRSDELRRSEADSPDEAVHSPS